jgi:hypothetical protein
LNEQQFKKLLIGMVSMGDYACKDELFSLLKIINVKFEKRVHAKISGV